ncbi:MAG: hypothetical protein ACT6Q7_16260 [Blastomonas fulva]|uniref:hypothetical protein n=1 Tax=Blastomonas fulva TaxID=1550728 RepID=UPI0040337BF9
MSFADLQIENLVELYLGEESGRAVIEVLGRNRDKSGLLLSLINANEPDDDLANALRGCLAAYSIHRENRNKLAHAFSITRLDSGQQRWHRASGKIHPPVSGSDIDAVALDEMIKQIDRLNGELSFGFMFKAQELGYEVFAGSVRIGRPTAPPIPDKFKDTDRPAIEASLTRMKMRGESNQ